MSLDVDEFAELCPLTIVWQPVTGTDEYNKPTYGAAQTFRGRRVKKQTRVYTRESATGAVQEQISESKIWILGTPDVKNDDKLYVSGDTTFPPILTVAKFDDEDGPHHVEVMMGSYKGL